MRWGFSSPKMEEGLSNFTKANSMSDRKNIIIVLNYNDYKETTRFCSVIGKYDIIDLIIVVDNKSTDDSYNHLLKLGSSKVVILSSDSNRGYSAGNNIGLKYILDNKIKGNIIISNPDIEVSQEVFSQIFEKLQDENIGIATGLVYANGVISDNYAWKIPSFWTLIADRFVILGKIRRVLGISMYMSKPIASEIYCECVSGCFFGFSTNTLNKIGLFDERTFLFGEETILGWKIKQNKLKTVVLKNAIVHHNEHHSLKLNSIKMKRNMRWELDSHMVYVKYYLKKGRLSQCVFKFFFVISCIERMLLEYLKTTFKS